MQKRAEKTRNALLTGGIKLFAEKGFAATSVGEIAEEAGANKQRIYAYFGSKQGLLEQCLATLFQKVEKFSEDMVRKAEANPALLTEILFDGFWAVHEKYPEFQRILAWVNLENTAQPELLFGARSKENSRLKAVFEIAVNTGVLKPTEFRFYLLTVMSLAYFCHSNAHTLDLTVGVPPREQMGAELARMFHADDNAP